MQVISSSILLLIIIPALCVWPIYAKRCPYTGQRLIYNVMYFLIILTRTIASNYHECLWCHRQSHSDPKTIITGLPYLVDYLALLCHGNVGITTSSVRRYAVPWHFHTRLLVGMYKTSPTLEAVGLCSQYVAELLSMYWMISIQ